SLSWIYHIDETLFQPSQVCHALSRLSCVVSYLRPLYLYQPNHSPSSWTLVSYGHRFVYHSLLHHYIFIHSFIPTYTHTHLAQYTIFQSGSLSL
ncbi:hypothetical protein K443DRAFT_101095, partial [Laccaria amethystina LaAM-08-1]